MATETATEARTSTFSSIILYAMTKVYNSSTVVDIGPEALTLALDAMAALAKRGERPLEKKALGVRVSATDPKFTEVNISLAHPIFAKRNVSKVSQLARGTLPLQTYKQPSLTPAALIASEPAEADAPANPIALLHTIVDPGSPDFSFIPADIKTDLTTTLVAFTNSSVGNMGMPLSTDSLHSALEKIRDRVIPVLKDGSRSPAERYLALAKNRTSADEEFAFCTFLGSTEGSPDGDAAGAVAEGTMSPQEAAMNLEQQLQQQPEE